MPVSFLALSPSDRAEAFEAASSKSGRPAYLLEKDVWVVWALSVITKQFAEQVIFKGGTSLSKAYGAIDRFSEDVDLTYDIRHLLKDEDGLKPGVGDGLPSSGSKARRWTEKVREKLPQWIEREVQPLFIQAIRDTGLDLQVSLTTSGTLQIDYKSSVERLSSYVKPQVILEFGARSTGEPAERRPVTCDISSILPDVSFPTASPRVMAIERTFWEKATAAHVYCLQADLKSERFARHWHDLAALARHSRYRNTLVSREVAEAVAQHKSLFFKAKDLSGSSIGYLHAVRGNLRLVPEGDAARALEQDYIAMHAAGLFHDDSVHFADLMHACQAIEKAVNEVASASRPGLIHDVRRTILPPAV